MKQEKENLIQLRVEKRIYLKNKKKWKLNQIRVEKRTYFVNCLGRSTIKLDCSGHQFEKVAQMKESGVKGRKMERREKKERRRRANKEEKRIRRKWMRTGVFMALWLKQSIVNSHLLIFKWIKYSHYILPRIASLMVGYWDVNVALTFYTQPCPSARHNRPNLLGL